MAWKRENGLIAERFGKEEMPGFLTKQFEAKGDEFVVLERDGEIYLEKGHGVLTMSTVMHDFTNVLLLDKSEKTIESDLKNICFADGRSACVRFAVKFRILNSDHFSKRLMGERKRLFLADVWDDAVSAVLYKKIIPALQKKGAADAVKGDFADKACQRAEQDIKRKFREWGLMLTAFSMKFILPDEPERLENPDSEPAKGPEKAGTAQIAAIAGNDTEEAADSLERKRLEREVAMELDKKQMQKDVQDALEAMELKDVQRKRKAAETGTKEAERETLREELENMKKAKEITERKFYKKELSEESFQRMMEEFERKIIEIEAKLRVFE